MTLPKFAIALLLLTFMVLVGAPRAQAAISCGTVDNNMVPCLGYLQTGGPVPDTCCQGIQSLYNAARTTEDRQSACKCLKSAAGMVSGINLDLAANLPSQCGVNIPYKISPNTNCNDVK